MPKIQMTNPRVCVAAISRGSGLSTILRPDRLPRPLKPMSLGGMSVLPLFAIEEERLTAFHLQGRGHHVQVEPKAPMPVAAFQALLCGTRGGWHIWRPETP